MLRSHIRLSRWRALVVVLVGVVGAGCGAGPGTPLASGPSTVSTPTSEGPLDHSASGGPTEESAAQFGAVVLGRLEQEAFWASDPAFLRPYVADDQFEQVAAALDAHVEPVRWAIATFPGPTKRTWFATAPLTVRVVAFDPEAATATVEVWMVSVFSREDLGPPETRWSTERAELVWVASAQEWRILGLSVTSGPAPPLAPDQVPVTPAELDAALAGHLLIPVPQPDKQ